MDARIRVRGLVFGVCAAGGLLGLAGVPATGAAPLSVTDRVGDTVTDAVEEAIVSPSADIVATSADSRPEGISLAFRVAKATDPLADGNWASELTLAGWLLDTDANGKPDYVIDYYRDPETRALTADLDRVGPGHPPDECQPKAAYDTETGYTTVVDPKCLGGATGFSYRVELAYTTDANDDAADVATDLSPDTGWTGPVAVTLPAGAMPVALVPPTQVDPSPEPPSNSPVGPDSGAEPRSGSAGPSSSAAAPKPVAPQQAHQRSRPTSAAPPHAADTAPRLARTGLGDRTVRMAGFAVGIGLMGIGLLFANRRPSASLVPIGRGGRVNR